MKALEAVPSRFADAPPAMRQIPLDLGPGVAHGLDDFLAGRNTEALAWLRAWPQVQGPVSPAYFWGPSGVGKTHLLRAMVERALSMGLGAIWLNAHTCQMWDAEDPAAPTLAVIDDCERLPADHQHLAFNLFIQSASSAAALTASASASLTEDAADLDASSPAFELTMSTSPEEAIAPLFILAAGAVPPVDLPVRDDLRTRLGWGLSFALAPLDEPGLRLALRHEATRRGMALSDEVLGYLLTRHSRDLGFLMRLLDRLDHFTLAEQRQLTIPLLKQMLALETA